MTLQKSKIVSLQGAGTWESQKFGTMYQFDISLENGQSGDYSSSKYTSVEALPFSVGEEIEYEYDTSNAQYPKIKKPLKAGSKRWSQNGQFSGGNDEEREIRICRQSSLTRAVEVLTHNNQGGIVKPSDVIKYADYFTNYVMTGNPEKSPKEPKAQPVEPPKQEAYSDDLPF